MKSTSFFIYFCLCNKFVCKEEPNLCCGIFKYPGISFLITYVLKKLYQHFYWNVAGLFSRAGSGSVWFLSVLLVVTNKINVTKYYVFNILKFLINYIQYIKICTWVIQTCAFFFFLVKVLNYNSFTQSFIVKHYLWKIRWLEWLLVLSKLKNQFSLSYTIFSCTAIVFVSFL